MTKLRKHLDLQHHGRVINVSIPQHFSSSARGALKLITVHSAETANLLNQNTDSFVIASVDFEGKIKHSARTINKAEARLRESIE